MKYLFHSKFADSFFLAKWMAEHNKNVVYFIYDEPHKDVGRNMGVVMVDDFYKELKKDAPQDTIVVFDQTGFGYLAEYLKKQGYFTAYASAIADKLEEDRTFATQLLSEVMSVPKTSSFKTFDEGRGFLKGKSPSDRYVFKPNGEDTPSDWTYVSKNRDDMLNQIDYYESNWNLPAVSFELQEFIEGIEVDFSGVMTAYGDWLGGSFELYFEDKKFLDGNKGMTVGCADAMQYFTSAEEPLFKDVLTKLTGFLAKNKFNGQCAINMIVSKKDHKPYALEISPRFGYDSIQNEVHTLLASNKDPSLLINAVACNDSLPENYFPQGTKPYNYAPQGPNYPPQPRIAMAVRISVPPYPNVKYAKDAKGTVVSYEHMVDKNVYLHDVSWNKNEKRYECVGSSGVIATAAVTAASPENAIKKMYTTILPNIYARSIQYRMDAAKRVSEDIKTLRSWGVIL